MSESGVLQPEDWALWRDLASMRQSVERALEQRLQRDAGISLPDFEVLHALSVAPDNRLRAGVLAERMGWEKSRISHQVRRMADRDLLIRADCPTDARGTWVVLAEGGIQAFASASCGYVEVLQRTLFDRIEPAQRRIFVDVVARLAEPADLAERTAATAS